MRTILTLTLLASSAVYAQGLAEVFDGQVSTVEREVLGLARKVPASAYDFAPKTGIAPNGIFDGVRDFKTQVKHTATMMYMISSSVLGGEKAPVDIGPTDDGPTSLTAKDDIIRYFEGAIAFAHRAMKTITAENALDDVPSPFGRGTMKRAAAAAFLGQHSYDHYGQMVVYARMNGITPGGPPPGGSAKGKGKGE